MKNTELFDDARLIETFINWPWILSLVLDVTNTIQLLPVFHNIVKQRMLIHMGA